MAQRQRRKRGEGIKKFPFGFLSFWAHKSWFYTTVDSITACGVVTEAWLAGRVSGKLVCLFGLSCGPLLSPAAVRQTRLS